MQRRKVIEARREEGAETFLFCASSLFPEAFGKKGINICDTKKEAGEASFLAEGLHAKAQSNRGKAQRRSENLSFLRLLSFY
jgi:hypothetical protein